MVWQKGSGYGPVINEMEREGITLSTVALGEGGRYWAFKPVSRTGRGKVLLCG